MVERTNPTNLSYDCHVCAVAYAHPYTDTMIILKKINLKTLNNK